MTTDTDTATHEGVVEDAAAAGSAPAEDSAEYQSPRDMAMDQLHANRMQSLTAEVVEGGGSAEPEPEPEAEAADDDEDGHERQIAIQSGALDEDSVAAGKVKVKVKVDGEESEVSIEDLRRSYQKDAAATKRLDEASRLLREARETHERATAAATAKDELPDEDPGNDDVRVAVRGALDSLLDGDEEKATELLAGAVEKIAGKQALAGRGDATLDQNAIARQVKQEIEQDSALAKFATDYKEIVSDPYLAELADRHLDAELKSGKHMTYADALNASGDKVRDWMKERGLAVGDEQKSPTTDLGQRRERKQGLDTVSGASVRSASTEPPQATTASVLSEMRQARGQA